MSNPFQPRFQHDCKNCHFFGQSGDLDLYYCARSEADFGGSVVARYGNDAPEYHSSPVSVLLGSILERGVHAPHDVMVRLAKKLLGDGYVRLSTNYGKLRDKAADDADWNQDEHTKHCAVCGEPQFEVPSGTTCKNGHGGAPAKEG